MSILAIRAVLLTMLPSAPALSGPKLAR